MKAAAFAILAIHALACMFPLVWLFCSAFKSNPEFFNNPGFIPTKFSPGNFANAWVKGRFGDYFINNVLYAAATVLLVDVVASLAAFSMAILKSKALAVAFLAMVATVLIPAPGSFIQIFTMLKSLGMLDTRAGYIMVMAAINLSVSVFILKGFFESVPSELVDAAKIDGASLFRVWWRVCMPIAMPAVATVSIFAMLSVWNDYIIAAVTFSTQKLMPIQQGLLTFQGQYQTRYDWLIAATAISIIPLIAFYVFFNKQVLQGVVEGAVKG
jgi:multiple sugar transport system permease protein/raffinose/stachyose/melibiose transport system permease protein